MTWTYDPSQLATSKVMQVRLLIGDTIATDKFVQDEEIAFYLTQRPSIYGSAAMACRALSARLSREADTVDKDLRTVLSARARNFSARAVEYENKAMAGGGAMPYAGGLSIIDKVSNEANLDRVQPQFNLGMDDNLRPVAPAGNEGTQIPWSDGNV